MLQKLSNISKGRRSAMVEILLLYLSCRGRMNFSQFGRQGDRYEKTYRYHFEKEFNWSGFNGQLIKSYCSEELIIGFDPSYIRKSGKHTPGLGYFYSGVAGGYKKGLEIGSLAIIDIQQNTAYHYESITTPSSSREKIKDGRTIVDHYADLIIQRAEELVGLSLVLVVDGYFAKKKFVNGVCEQTPLEVICRLRDDANLKYLAPESKVKKRGRPKLYSGKVDVQNIDKDKFEKEYEDEEMRLYSLIVHSVGLKRNIKVSCVEFLDSQGKPKVRKLFFSTNLERSGLQIYNYYKARFQMEFIFRDSKQYTGLEHCQSRSPKKLNFHFNASMTSINVAKCILRNGVDKNTSIPLSIGDLKMKLQNRNMLYRIFSIYGFDHKLIKINRQYRQILKYGNIAA
ncbi:MAG: transposase [Bacteroidota bacterium]